MTSILSNGISTIKNKYEEFRSNGSNLMSRVKDGISSAKGGVVSTVQGAMSSVSSAITGVTNSAHSWGYDMMSGLSRGIQAAKGYVVSGVKGVASAIKSLLHFSRPDEGPLRDYETWMPDFMEGMAEGIARNKSKLIDNVKSVSNELATSFNSLEQPEIAFAGSQELNVNHYIKTNDNKLSDLIKNYFEELGNRNNDDAQVIVSVLYELLEELKSKNLDIDADALNDSNNKKELEKLLRRGK